MKNLSLNKGRPSCLCIFIYALLLSNQISANELTFRSYTKQSQQQITGTVTDALGPLPSVTVMVKGTALSTVTDEKGNFSITANSTDILVFSFIGYATQEILIGNKTSFNIVLAEDSTQLKEVTINAGYYKVKDKERTGSIERITAKDIEIQPVTNAIAVLAGRMPGVTVTQASGVAGASFDITIRGINSLRADGNTPLYIIDGVPYSTESIGLGSTNTVQPGTTSPLNNINPADIESLEVLKDADATAIYGSRGANGVVLITTKKGKIGKTQIFGSYSKGSGQVTRFMDLMNTQQYLAMRDEAYANDGYSEPPFWAYDVNGTWDRNRYTDWQKELLGRSADFTQIRAGLSGGSENTQFLMSSNFNKETTVFPGDFAYKKGNVHATLSHKSDNGKFNITFSGSYTFQDNNQPSADLTTAAWTLAPNAPSLYDEDGKINWEDGTFSNPISKLQGSSKTKTFDLVANSVISYAIMPSFLAKVNLGYTDLTHNESSTFPSTIYDPSWGLGSESSYIFYGDAARRSWIIEPQLSYDKVWGKFKTQFLAGSTFQRTYNQVQAMGAYGFPSNKLLYNPAAATTLTILGNDISEYKYQAFFGRVNINYGGRYILNLTGRRDGSSRFGPGNRFAWFGAMGAAWVFTEEEWLQHQNFLSFGKLRASYGSTGSDQIGNYQFLDTYTPSGNGYNGIGGLQPTLLYNPNFGWETNRKGEIALETGFFNDRVFFTWAWFNNRSSNQLVGTPLPGTTGFDSIQANLAATVENSGVELSLRTANYKSENFSWTTTINISFLKNKLLEFPGLEDSTYANQYVIGKPLNIVKLYHFTGLNPETGVYTFEDYNGDGIISASEDKQMVADLNPKYFGGIGNEFQYKSWQLDFLFQFVKQDNYAASYMLPTPGGMTNQSTDVIIHWTQPGDTSGVQPYTSGTNAEVTNAHYQFIASDGVIRDGSYVRLKNLSLSYGLPKDWFKGECRLFLRGQNLLTFTKYKGADPEFRAVGTLPPLRVITGGIDFRF
ncbi:SusC/RagA family TonB-linked outer membrane protein [Flavobacterium plurextorum]|uniref:SusC/RagA family TonB-linked outer membrane protein n=1 Tax=Flavobacterium plurextorum TaxID=1114867 RepID=UPI0037564923